MHTISTPSSSNVYVVFVEDVVEDAVVTHWQDMGKRRRPGGKYELKIGKLFDFRGKFLLRSDTGEHLVKMGSTGMTNS
jgi:hypothetical protein